jgi:outer membrane protein, heavy metal efflux system
MHSSKPYRRLRIVLALAFGGASCASVDPSADHAAARELIQTTTGRSEVYDPDEPPLMESDVQAVLVDGLALDEALRLALVGNRRLRAGFAALGVARADYEQAGLLRNPRLGLGFLLPSGGGRTKVEGELGATLSELWELPRRKAAQRNELERRILELSAFAGALVADTKDAYYECVAARESQSLSRESAELARQGLDAARRRVIGGVATRTEEVLAESAALTAELDARRTEALVAQAARRLGAALSLDADLVSVPLIDALPEPSGTTFERERLVAIGQGSRLDLRASRRGVDAAEAEVALERRQRWGTVEGGLAFERPEGGGSTNFLAGPTGSIELPLFDQHQVRIARAEYRRDQLRHEHDALVAETGQAIRAAADRAAAASATARFVQSDLLVRAESGAALARSAFEQGRTTLLPYLESQRALAVARRTRIDALLEAARSRHDLERALGRPLVDLEAARPGP